MVRSVADSAVFSAVSTDAPVKVEATVWPTCVPMPWNSGMATN